MTTEPTIKVDDLATVAKPSARHTHMKDVRGRVETVSVNKVSHCWVAKVRFMGAAGRFNLNELERVAGGAK